MNFANSKSFDDHLVERMLEETFSNTEAHDTSNVIHLSMYFEKRRMRREESGVIKFMCEMGVRFAMSALNRESKCYRFHVDDRVFDVPSNWSAFSGVSYAHFSSDNDPDRLLSVFRSIYPDLRHMVVFRDGADVVVSFLSNQESYILEIILDYLENESSPLRDAIARAA